MSDTYFNDHSAPDQQRWLEALNDGNGFIRERAVRGLARALPDWALPLLVTRLNDWVPQVRLAAREMLRAYLAADRFEAIVALLPALQRLRRTRRESHAELVGEVENWLARHPRARSLLADIANSSPTLARTLFELLLRSPEVDPAVLASQGLRAGDSGIRRRAAKLAAALPADRRAPLIATLLRFREPGVHLLGLGALAPEEARAAATARLFHPARTVRLWAEEHSSLSAEALAEQARGLLAQGVPDSRAFAVAAQLAGERRDHQAEPLLQSAYERCDPSRRGVLLLALARLAPDRYRDEVVACLGHPALKVATAAALAAQEQEYDLSLAEWTAAAAHAPSDRHARLLLALARKRSKWHHLGVILELGRDARRRRYAWAVFGGWIDRWAAMNPTPPAALARWLVERRGGLVPPHPRAHLVLAALG